MMKQFLRVHTKDKQFVKMINNTESKFELIILSDDLMRDYLELIHTCEEEGDAIDVIWQTKHKDEIFIQYKKCVFSAPMDNFSHLNNTLLGKKFKVTCDEIAYYTSSDLYKNKLVRNSKHRYQSNNSVCGSNNIHKYQDISNLMRMLKISNLNIKSKEL